MSRATVRLRGALVLLGVLLGSCTTSSTPTELIVVVDAEQPLKDDIDRLDLQLAARDGKGAPFVQHTFLVTKGQATDTHFPLPLSFVVEPRDDEDDGGLDGGNIDASDSGWSAVRYLDVGRTPSDFNGDGWSDVVVGVNGRDIDDRELGYEGKVFVYYGSANGIPTKPDTTLDNPESDEWGRFGDSATSAGDVNGDGFADLVVGAIRQDVSGKAFVYHGSANGIPAMPEASLDNPADQASGWFGISVSSAGDVNGDGFADLVVGADGQTAAFVYHGSADGIPTMPHTTLDDPENPEFGFFGFRVSTAGDVNRDGFADLVVGAFGQDEVFVYHGSADGIPTMPHTTLDNPDSQESGRFGRSVSSARDVNGDGFADLMVGAYRQEAEVTDEGKAFVYRGSASGIPTTSTINP